MASKDADSEARAAAPRDANEEYELVPHSQLEYLQHEVERIKRNPFGDSASSKDLLSAMDALNKNIGKLVQIFETANDEIVRDYKDKANTERINRMLDQNEKLAKGMVTIADLLKEMKEGRNELFTPTVPPMAEGQRQEQMTTPMGTPMVQPMPQEWQNALNPGAPQNPFLSPESGPSGPPGMPPGIPPPGMAPGMPGMAGGKRNLPPIDAFDVPPPPPR